VLSAVFMANVDLWIVNVALVAVQRDLTASLSSLSWVLNGYAVTLAALLTPAGRLGDRTGHRKVFLAGMAIFTLASAVCAVAPSVAVLVVARVVQAAGAAAQLPTSLALLVATVTPDRRLTVARGWSAVGGLAAACGPVLGGLLVLASWRWVFLVNLPIGLVAWIAGRRVVPHAAPRHREPPPDLLGSGLLIVAVGAVTGALVEAPSWGWTSASTLALVCAALLGLAAFVWRCRVHPHPMLELSVFRVRAFSGANIAAFLFSIAFGIQLLANALWCQDIWLYSALRTGLAVAPGPAMVPIATMASTRLVARIGPGAAAALGGACFAVGQLWRAVFATAAPDYVGDLLPSVLLSGVGVGLGLNTLVAAAATALPDGHSATASAVVNSCRQVASALGVALLVTVMGATTGSTAGVYGYRVSWVIAAALSLFAAIAGLCLPKTRRPHP
jgi:EmrB/QacA subfamily drug resistance transporter